MRNRLNVLLAHDALFTGAAAMARSSTFRAATAWLHEAPPPPPLPSGPLPSSLSLLPFVHKKRPLPPVDRLKLGGIHRAQPFSHHCDRGHYQHFFVAP
jgi:hypothetical protein